MPVASQRAAVRRPENARITINTAKNGAGFVRTLQKEVPKAAVFMEVLGNLRQPMKNSGKSIFFLENGAFLLLLDYQALAPLPK
jgi:hypothetical protein